MRNLRFVLCAAWMGVTTLAICQTDTQKANPPQPVQSEAQKSFDQLKTLAGTWEAQMDGKTVQVSLRVTSLGNAVLHEMKVAGRPEDPITVFHLDGNRLMLTHYCDMGNQPRMVAAISPDGKTLTYTFIDGTNLMPAQPGHMQRATFNFIDADHHTEKWEFAMNGGQTMGGLLDLKRVK